MQRGGEFCEEQEARQGGGRERGCCKTYIKILNVSVAREKRKQGKEKENAFRNNRVEICSSALKRAICEQEMEKSMKLWRNQKNSGQPSQDAV